MIPSIIVQGSSLKYAELPPKRSIHNPDKPTKEYQKAIESAIEVHPESVNFVNRLIYPINGYAPGSYSCICGDCERVFHGDKRAVRCPECAKVDGVYPIEAKVRYKLFIPCQDKGDCQQPQDGWKCMHFCKLAKQYAILEPENSGNEGSQAMTLQEQKEQLRKESGAAYRCPTFEFMWGKLQEKQAEIAELEKKYQNVSSWNVDALKQINEHKAEIQKLHDHYQKQIGEWEEYAKNIKPKNETHKTNYSCNSATDNNVHEGS